VINASHSKLKFYKKFSLIIKGRYKTSSSSRNSRPLIRKFFYKIKRKVLPKERKVLLKERKVLPKERKELPKERKVLPKERKVLSKERKVLL
jgi:hypothetical protein